MADDLKRVGLVFKADGAVDFKKTLDQVNTSVQENRNAFKLAKAAWDESTSTVDKLRDRQEYLAKQTEAYSDKVNVLQQELDQLESAEKRNEKAIRKKQNQLTQAKTSLLNYQKGLQDVTNQLTSGSGAAEDEMKSLDSVMGNLTAAAQENETAFDALKSGYDENTKSVKKYGDQQKYLTDQVGNYENQVKTLKSQLDILESAEDKNERAIREKRSELNRAEKSLNEYKNSLDEVEKKLKSGADKTEDYTRKLDSFGGSAKGIGEKLSGVSTAAAGLAGAVAATVPATEEYRKIMGTLEVSSEAAGYSAEQTMESYKTLYGVLGDDQTAATTTANLQAIGLSQQDLTTVINGTIGAWAKYGDSIPIDGLAESINETIRAGQVTGNFADVLNWGSAEGETFGVKMKANTEANKAWNESVASAATAEDYFNLALQEAGSQAERANLVMQLLANQGLTEAGTKWQENNQNLMQGNQATADFQAATSELAETVAPIITQVTEIVAGLIEKFNALPPETQKTIGFFVLLVAVVGPLISGIGSLSLGIKALIPLFTGLWGIMSANPIGAIVTIIGLLVTALVTAYNKCEWFRDAVNDIFESIEEAIDWIGGKLEDFFSFEWVADTPIIGDIAEMFSGTGRSRTVAVPMRAPAMPVKWFAKGGILNRPTIFGRDGNTVLGGGEDGAEAVLPIDLLKQYIREENQANNSLLAALIQEALADLSISAENNIYIGDKKFETVVTKMVMKKISNKVKNLQSAKGR